MRWNSCAWKHSNSQSPPTIFIFFSKVDHKSLPDGNDTNKFHQCYKIPFKSAREKKTFYFTLHLRFEEVREKHETKPGKNESNLVVGDKERVRKLANVQSRKRSEWMRTITTTTKKFVDTSSWRDVFVWRRKKCLQLQYTR